MGLTKKREEDGRQREQHGCTLGGNDVSQGSLQVLIGGEMRSRRGKEEFNLIRSEVALLTTDRKGIAS